MQLEETEQLITAGQACDVVIKVFTCIKTAWNRVRNMFTTVLTTITTIHGDQALTDHLDFNIFSRG